MNDLLDDDGPDGVVGPRLFDLVDRGGEVLRAGGERREGHVRIELGGERGSKRFGVATSGQRTVREAVIAA